MGEATSSLRAAMRRLWADHVIWTRQYVVAAVEHPMRAAAGRLLKNQEDIGTPSCRSTARRPARAPTSSSSTS